MAFTYTRKITDEEEKTLAVAAKLATFNDQPVPSAPEFLDARVVSFLDRKASDVKAANDRNSVAALVSSDEATRASVDALLAVTKLEDQVAGDVAADSAAVEAVKA